VHVGPRVVVIALHYFSIHRHPWSSP
jgi:hypothetical protein